MSWSQWSAALVGAKPVWLYRLEKDGELAFYTSRSTKYSVAPTGMPIDFFYPADFFTKVDIFAETFYPVPIAHTTIRATSKAAKKQVTITLPKSNAFGQKFVGPLGISSTEVSIYQGFANDVDQEFFRIFRGSVQVTKPSFAITSLICEDSANATRGNGLSAVIQRPCRHALYHGECRLTLSEWQLSGTASAFSGGTVTVAQAASQANGYYSGGIIAYGSALQLITSHTGSTLKVLGSVGSLQEDIAASGAKTVSIAPGCNRSMSVCDGRFSNSLNFGGFEYLTESPFDGRSIT